MDAKDSKRHASIWELTEGTTDLNSITNTSGWELVEYPTPRINNQGQILTGAKTKSASSSVLLTPVP